MDWKSMVLGVTILAIGAMIGRSLADLVKGTDHSPELPFRMTVGDGNYSALVLSVDKRIGSIAGFTTQQECERWALPLITDTDQRGWIWQIACLPLRPNHPPTGNFILPEIKR